MSSSITGIGLALPECAVSQSVSAQYSLDRCVANEKQRRVATRLYERSGVDSRHSVLLAPPVDGGPATQSYYQPPSDSRPLGPSTADRMEAYRLHAGTLAHQAARRALRNSGDEPDCVTHLVTVSCSGFAAPGFDITLIHQLGVTANVARTHVGFMGCHGALNGLRVAKAFVDADAAAKVLVVAVELCSLHYQYEWTNERMVTNALFADGAAAMVVGRAARPSVWRLEGDLCEIVPNSLDAMTWQIGDHGFEMTLSPAVPDLILQHLRQRVTAWLDRSGLQLADISAWAVHPGGPRILQACQQALGLDDRALAASFEVLRRCGNMSSPTVVFVLDELRRQQITGPVVALGFGPGLAIEARLLRR